MTNGEYCELVDELNRLSKLYSTGNSPVDDVTYDAKYRQLKEYEINNPDLILPESPTQNVSEELTDGFRKVKHEIPMISITNANGIEEAVAWVQKTRDDYGVTKFELEYKIDGASLALVYRNGLIDDAVTRGKNNVGDSVVNNAVKILGVQQHVSSSGLVEVRGEVVWKYDDFDAFNDQLEELGKQTLANPRNGAAGSLKLTSPKEVEARRLSYIAYIVARGSENDTQTADVEWLESQGFEVPPHYTVDIDGDDGIENFRKVAEDMRSRRNALEYPIDGIVIKVDDKEMHDTMGYTSKAPNFYKAYKFPPEEKETALVNIEMSIGRSGAITPVAVVEPVDLAMTTVRRCTLHNWDLVDYLGLFHGCHVVIRKAGEIIPEIVKCVETGRSKDDYELDLDRGCVKPYIHHDNERPYYRPALCPFCAGELNNAVNSDGKKLVAWVCKNEGCQAQSIEKLCNFADRTVMNIRGVGPSMIDALYQAHKLESVDDFYKLTVSDLIECGGCREKKANKLISAINSTRSNTLDQLIEGFGISGIGHTASPVLAKFVNDNGGFIALMAMLNQPDGISVLTSSMVNYTGLSSVIADKFARYLYTHQDIIRYFLDNKIAQTFKETGPVSDKLAGEVCIMTGVFDKLERDVFKDLVVRNGGKVCSGITKKTTIVLMGDGAGPKKVQAIEDLKASGIRIKVYTPDTLDEFMNIIA